MERHIVGVRIIIDMFLHLSGAERDDHDNEIDFDGASSAVRLSKGLAQFAVRQAINGPLDACRLVAHKSDHSFAILGGGANKRQKPTTVTVPRRRKTGRLGGHGGGAPAHASRPCGVETLL